AIWRIRRNCFWSTSVDNAPTFPSIGAVPSRPATMCPVTQHWCLGWDRSTARYGAMGSAMSVPNSRCFMVRVYGLYPTVSVAQSLQNDRDLLGCQEIRLVANPARSRTL